MRDKIRRLIQEGKSVIGFEGVMNTKRERVRYVLSSSALVDFDGEACYLWASNDITERKLV